MIKVVLLDDHKMFAEGISTILDYEPHFELVATCFTHPECKLILEEHEVNVLLNDIQLEDSDGISFCKMVKSLYPNLKVLMLTMFSERSMVKLSLKNGADGYLLKSSGRVELLNAIIAVNRGERYLDEAIVGIVEQPSQKRIVRRSLIPKLSLREKEILKLIMEEFTTAEIAVKLFVSPKTVESHRSNLLAKFDVRNIAGLVRKAIEYEVDLEVP